jgi:hypothetical protein
MTVSASKRPTLADNPSRPLHAAFGANDIDRIYEHTPLRLAKKESARTSTTDGRLLRARIPLSGDQVHSIRQALTAYTG